MCVFDLHCTMPPKRHSADQDSTPGDAGEIEDSGDAAIDAAELRHLQQGASPTQEVVEQELEQLCGSVTWSCPRRADPCCSTLPSFPMQEGKFL
jgi:hypothetical protein